MIETIRARVLALAELVIGAAMVVAVVLARPNEGGTSVFLGIADKVASGLVPYRDFPLEYPPLALLPLALPRLIAPGSPDSYQLVFGVFSLVLALGTGAVVAWLARAGWSATSRRDTLLVFISLALAASPLILWRFDIFPALLTALALVAVAQRRPAWAGLALGLGAAAKLYPAFLVPILLAYYLAGRGWKNATWLLFGFVASLGAIVIQIFLLAGPDAFSFLTYQNERGIEIESVIGGIVLLAHSLFGTPAHIFVAFGSLQVDSPLIASLAAPGFVGQVLLGLLLLGGVVFSFVRDTQRFGAVRRQTLVRYLLATLLLVMLANKVLSPQFICWLLPFGALLPLRQSLLLVVICAATTIVYPLRWDGLVGGDPQIVVLLNVRNLLLLVLFVWLCLPQRYWAAEGQSVAMFETPPRKPAVTPNTRSPIASRRLCGAITVINRAANATVSTLASVRPGRPISSARSTTIGFASADIP